ncbi:hypothetical protein PP935_gp045 [Rhizobium phage RHph_N34]|uniref:Uncharacterized protein n=2 Tax=Trinifflemingvirus TaxID=3044848 RepID=A0A7S5UYF8_9CAUD|nr:hypothetical protein PP935_gp045 [Rhizobium phage RHph_N34]YP_010661677.1 hypothetical protein PP936_gp039 [Rhizobium phage RHph_I1_9]QIG69609.1 hypothetical protein EVB81_040 [Rhizobium phage RHph_I46]QIG70890.1 hypothetical protein EVB92_040 [Rhizobium phage RHph_I9]QIG76229.1 hypothetical protein EVC25_040 [Rhizobium phage RHph_I34]QIG73476.1 hypothetical protein EVC04_039 [Rhizobium phage RHph_I1_9]QIG73820.1 hypothetical protein EVC06_045 [Rhizobium phage RHph_N34]
MKNIYAYTTAGEFYPSYISVNNIDNNYSFTVRGEKIHEEAEGRTGNIVLTRDEVVKLIFALEKALLT